MDGINKVMLLGRLGRAPITRYSQNGYPFGNFSLATNHREKNSAGEYEQVPEWHSINVLGKTAENCQRYLDKGSIVAVEGKIKSRKYIGKSDNVERTVTDIVASKVTFINPIKQKDNQAEHEAQQEDTANQDLVSAADDLGDDLGDIPF